MANAGIPPPSPSRSSMNVQCHLTITAGAGSCSIDNKFDTSELKTTTVFSNLDDFNQVVTVIAGYDKIASQTGKAGDSAAPERLCGSVLAGVAAVFGGFVLLL